MITPPLPCSPTGAPLNERRTADAPSRLRLVRRSCFLVAFLLATSCGSSGSDSASSDSASSDSASSDSASSDSASSDSASSDSAGSDGDTTTQTAAAPSSDDEAAASTPSDSGANGDSGTGTIEIGGDRHDLTITRCIQMAGSIGGDGVGTDEPENITVNFSFSPEDWTDRTSEGWTEDGSVRLDSEEPYRQWESGESLVELYNLPDGTEASSFTVTSYDVADDGQSVSGEAVFLELTALLSGEGAEPQPGTFSFSCPPAG